MKRGVRTAAKKQAKRNLFARVPAVHGAPVLLPPGAPRCSFRQDDYRCGLPEGHAVLPHEVWCEVHGDFVAACRGYGKRGCKP